MIDCFRSGRSRPQDDPWSEYVTTCLIYLAAKKTTKDTHSYAKSIATLTLTIVSWLYDLPVSLHNSQVLSVVSSRVLFPSQSDTCKRAGIFDSQNIPQETSKVHKVLGWLGEKVKHLRGSISLTRVTIIRKDSNILSSIKSILKATIVWFWIAFIERNI